MLPLAAGGATASLLAGCGGGDDPTFVSASFVSMAAPSLANAAAMATTTVGSTMNIALSDGSTRSVKLAYQPFFVTGDRVPDGKGGTVIAGGCSTAATSPSSTVPVAGQERQFFSDSPDGTSLLSLASPTVSGVKGKAVFAVVQFEYATRDQAGTSMYGVLPSPIAVLTLDQDPATGKLSLLKYHNVDTSAAHGLSGSPAAPACRRGTRTWPARSTNPMRSSPHRTASWTAFSKNTFGDETVANPYHYGHLPEVTVNPDGSGSIRKHYCLGRISHELVQVMPDNRTVLMGDDYTNGGLFLFIADKEKDLSAGTLYVAKVGAGFSTDAAAAGAALSWIKLGSATSAESRRWPTAPSLPTS